MNKKVDKSKQCYWIVTNSRFVNSTKWGYVFNNLVLLDSITFAFPWKTWPLSMTLDKCWGICRFKRVVTNFHPTTQKLHQCVHLYFHKNIVYTSLPKVPKDIDGMVIMTYLDVILSVLISNGYFLLFAF